MSDDPPTDAIQDYDTTTNPYIRGLYGEICDHLRMLAEAWRPPTIQTGNVDIKFPGYAKGAQEASEIFGSWIQELEDAIDILFDLTDGLSVGPLPGRFEHDRESTTPGGLARAHTHYLVTTRNYPMRFAMTAEETRSADVKECKRRMIDAAVNFRDMRTEALDIAEMYLVILQQAGYEAEYFYGDNVRSSLPTAVQLPRSDLAPEPDAVGGSVNERFHQLMTEMQALQERNRRSRGSRSSAIIVRNMRGSPGGSRRDQRDE